MASTSLSRTPSSNGNKKTFTISSWVKISTTSSEKSISHAGTTGGNYTLFDFNSSNQLRAIWTSGGSTLANVSTNAVYRDTNAWYHVVFAVDTTQATSSDRIKFYVNGEQITSFSSSTYPSQNTDTFHNDTSYANNVGKYISTGGSDTSFFDGSMGHYHFIDGTAYDASAFGETDATTGIWKPKTAPSVTYGTNGFFLKFENSGSMGTDSSGNVNNFSVNGNLTQTIDTPSNVFATLNTLIKPTTDNLTIENGNLSRTNGTSAAWTQIYTTIGASSGKWYFEAKIDSTSNSDGFLFGIADVDSFNNSSGVNIGTVTRNYLYQSNGNKRTSGTDTSFGDTLTTGDIVGVAFDLDNNYIYFSKNGTWQNSGDPTSGASGTGSAFSITSGYTYCPAFATYYTTDDFSANFGNGYFGTTAVSSAENPDDGIGIFEYDVPTGYKALCTKSINAQEYS